MQSYSINVADQISNELIKSLSDDDYDDNNDSDDEKEYNHYEMQATNHLIHKDEVQENEQEAEEEEEEEEEDEEEIIDEDYYKTLSSDKDIKIAKMLNKNGYSKLNQLCFTDQGSVWRAKSPKKYGSKSVVIKIASKLHYKNTESNEDENILKEIDLIQRINKEQKECISLNVQNSIIQIIDTIDNEENYIVVLEDGGIDLFKFINDCHEQIKKGKITIKEWQKTIKLISKKVIELIHWLHSKMNVCHLDISLENVLISNINWISYPDQYKNYKKRLSPDFKLKLIDFGAAKHFVEKDCDGNISYQCQSIIGKLTYCSPQIYKLQNKLTVKTFDARKSDIWSYGVSLFIMAIGCPPWTQPDITRNKLFQTIVSEKNGLEFVLKAWKRSNYIDESMKDLLQKIFVINEKDRISTNDIIKHSWLC